MNPIVERILKEVDSIKYNNHTTIAVPFSELDGSCFFDKLNSLKGILDVLRDNHQLVLVEDFPSRKHWQWKIPIYLDEKYKFIQFNLKKGETSQMISCGSIWRRPVDGTVVEVQAIEGRVVVVEVLDGPGLMSNLLNFGVLEIFWERL